MADRIEQIRKLLARDTSDLFLNYSLGMELASAGRNEEAAGQFQRCIELDGNYLAAYGEAGKAYRAAGLLEQARAAFQAGLELAGRQGERHIQDFLSQQLESLGRK
jgi:tetratricopeptide (TPR) repeat protein